MTDFKQSAKELVAKMTLAEKVSQMCHTAPAIERLGIPAYNWWNEGLHGVARSGTATVFPQAIGLAASFDTDMMYQTATVISDEARAKYNEYRKFGDTQIYQGLTYWSPNINIFRDPRWGRGHETYGEDPYLTAQMGTAFVRGMQGDENYKYRKLDATLKHFAVHSGPEAIRHGFNVEVSEKDLWETYLYAFRYCIEHAHPSAVMGAYNALYGKPCCASDFLLEEVLREKMGFDGYVVSDCGAICDINQFHKYTENEAQSAAAAVNAGCDLNCGSAYKWLKAAVAEGLISEETITKSVERLFEARYRLGMFADDCKYDEIPYSVLCCDEHKALNRKMAHKAMVLLKNNGILPLKNGVKVAVIGPTADSREVLLGNYNGTPDEDYTLLRGIKEDSEGQVFYARGCHIFRDVAGDWAENPFREALIAAKQADVVILCMGLDPTMEGEQGDAYNGANGGDKADLELPSVQKKLIAAIKKLGKPTIFVNVSGSAVALGDPDEWCDAVMQVFYPGAMGGAAFADILYGKVSPSGRLPVTFYRSVEDLPPFEDYSMENRTYKFFKGTPVYPFGHGLSYADVAETWSADGKTATVENRSGMETDYTVLRYEYIPHKSLCGIKAVHLAAGETKTISFE